VTDDEIRSLVRVAIQKHLGAPTHAESGVGRTAPGSAAAPPQPPVLSISFGRYALPRAEDDTMCIIEPAVKCNHCGYCQCHGH
jgi:hypothetical protein